MANIAQLLSRYPDLENLFSPATEEDIGAFESQISARLPDDYREFLLVQNGAWLHFNDSVNDDVWVECLYGIAPNPDNCNDLRWAFDCFRGRVADGYIPIGSGGSYEHVCLCILPDHFGEIWGWNRDEEMSMPWSRIAWHVCDSFTEAIQGLRPQHYTLEFAERDARNLREPFRSILLCDEEKLLAFLQDAKQHPDGDPWWRKGARRIGLVPDINVRDKKGRTPLINAVAERPGFARLLLDHGANVHAVDNDGNPALYHCRSAAIASELLRHGADPLVKNGAGDELLVTKWDNDEVREVMLAHLERNGESIDRQRYEQLATQREKRKMLRWLEIAAQKSSPADDEVIYGANNGMPIEEAGLIVVVYSRYRMEGAVDDEGEEIPLALDRLVELAPRVFGKIDVTQGAAAGRYEICKSILADAG